MAHFTLDQVLTNLDQLHNKNGQGLTYCYIFCGDDIGQFTEPTFHYYADIDQIINELITNQQLYILGPDYIVNTLEECLSSEEAEMSTEEKLQWVKPTTFDFLELNGSSVLWDELVEYRFINQKDAQRFLAAVQERAYQVWRKTVEAQI